MHPDKDSHDPEVSLRPAVPSDMDTYHAWANDPDTRRNSFHPGRIPPEDHRKWFFGKLSDRDCAMFVLECGGIPAGQIRFDAGPEGIEIDFSVGREFRGRGLGKRLLELGVRRYPTGGSPPAEFVGIVKPANAASAKSFLAAGFRMAESRSIGGEACRVFRKPAA